MTENEEIREFDVMQACCGMDEDGYARAVCAVKMLFLTGETEPEEADEIVTDAPVVNIYPDALRTMIDLTFRNTADYEFSNLVLRLQEFVRMDLSARSDAVPSIMVTVSPKEWMGRVYLSAIHGMWCLMPEVAGGEVNTVRFFFENESVGCYTVDEQVFEEGEDEYEDEIGADV